MTCSISTTTLELTKFSCACVACGNPRLRNRLNRWQGRDRDTRVSWSPHGARRQIWAPELFYFSTSLRVGKDGVGWATKVLRQVVEKQNKNLEVQGQRTTKKQWGPMKKRHRGIDEWMQVAPTSILHYIYIAPTATHWFTIICRVVADPFSIVSVLPLCT
jgi:hypothetical protein